MKVLIVYWLSKLEQKAQVSQNYYKQKITKTSQIFFHSQEREKLHTTFTPRSARRPSNAGTPEVQFFFVELRLSVCSCFPWKASFYLLPQVRLRFLRLQIPPFGDAEAEFDNESIWVNH